MSYRNPEIITDKSGEILAQGLASFGQSVAAGITKAGANAAQIKKDRAAETANLRKLQTDVELQTNERANAFKTNLPKTSLNAKLNPIIDARLKQAADAQIALYNESDPELRAQYLKTIQSVDNFLVTTGTFIGNIKDEAEAWNALNPSDIDKTVGISGKDKESIKNNQGLLNLFSGKSTGEFDLFFDDKTNSISLNAKGEMGGVPWTVNDFNSFNYLTSGGELTYDIPDLASKTVETARKLVTDKQGELLPGVAKEQVTKRIYQDVVGKDNKKIGRVLMEGQIEELDSAKINSLINADVASSAKGFLAAPLTQQNAMYATQLDGDRTSWSDFIKENSDPAAQEAELERLFKKVAIEGIGKDFKSYEKNGETIYYRSVTPLKEVKPEKPEKTTPPTKDDKIDLKVQENLTKADNILKWEGIDDINSPISKSLANVDFESLVGNELGLKATPLNDTKSGKQIGWTILNPDLKQWTQDILFEETIPQINKKIKLAIGSNWAGLSQDTTNTISAADLIKKYSQSN
jgi:hypothetical protein